MNTIDSYNNGGMAEIPFGHNQRAGQQRGMKFSLYPSRPRTASGDSNFSSPAHSAPASPNSPQLPPLPISPREDPAPLLFSQRSFSSSSGAIGDGRPSYPPPPQQVLHQKPSEASRLRALNNAYRSRSSDRSTVEGADVNNLSRPRQPSLGLRKEPSRPHLQTSNTFPLRMRDEDYGPPPSMGDYRERGMSTSSSQSAPQSHLPTALRPSMSIPDYHSPDSMYSRQRNLNGASYKSGRALTRAEPEYSSQYRDYPSRPSGIDHDEVRASIRSALTTNSSFMGTSGTERSSVMTKSSATSIYGRDEGMSVDDAIGMYETGFQDSGVEDNDEDERPDTPDSQRKRIRGLKEAMNDEIGHSTYDQQNDHTMINDIQQKPLPNPVPEGDFVGGLAPPRVPGAMMIRDSTSFFRPGLLDTPKSSPVAPTFATGMDGSADIEEGYFSGKPNSRDGPKIGTESTDPTRDRYGFKKATQYTTRAQYDTWNGPYTEYLARRRKKWMALQKDSGLITEDPDRFPPKSVKVKRFVRKGIPPEWRGAAWFYYAGGPAMVAKHYGVYDGLVQQALAGEVTETDDEIIERDLNRTFPDNLQFKPDPSAEDLQNRDYVAPETPILRSLRRVLQAFSIYNPKIGYCQSLNFLAGLLLLFMDEEKSFWMLNIITRVYLPGTHDVNLEGANVDLGVLMAAIKEMMPSIWAKIGGELDGTPFSSTSMRLPPITLCTTAWFMSCFIGTLPIETTLRVWDSFFYEGSKTLFRIALTIFKIGETEIKAVTDPMEIFQVVQTIPRKLLDGNLVMESCFKRRNGFGHISQETIEKGRAERRKGYALERERAEGGGNPVAPMRPPGRKNTLFSRKKRTHTSDGPMPGG